MNENIGQNNSGSLLGQVLKWQFKKYKVLLIINAVIEILTFPLIATFSSNILFNFSVPLFFVTEFLVSLIPVYNYHLWEIKCRENPAAAFRSSLWAQLIIIGAPAVFAGLLWPVFLPEKLSIAADILKSLCMAVFFVSFTHLSILSAKNRKGVFWRLFFGCLFTALMLAILDGMIHSFYFGIPNAETDNLVLFLVPVPALITCAAVLFASKKDSKLESRASDVYLDVIVTLFIVALMAFFLGSQIKGIGITSYVFYCIGFSSALFITHRILFRVMKKDLIKSVLYYLGACAFTAGVIFAFGIASDKAFNRVPSLDEIESAGFIHYDKLFDDEFSYKSALASADDLTDKESISKIIESHKMMLGEKADSNFFERLYFGEYSSESKEFIKFDFFNTNPSDKYSVAYKLKNGETIIRRYTYKKNGKETVKKDLPGQSLEDKYYYQTTYGALTDKSIEKAENLRIAYGVFDDYKVTSKDEIKALLKAYRSDFEKNERPSETKFSIRIRVEGTNFSYSAADNFTHTIDYLKSLGILNEDGERNNDSEYKK